MSRLNEHRTDMPKWHWLVGLFVLVAALLFGVYAKGAAESESGVLPDNAPVCRLNVLRAETAAILEEYTVLINELQAAAPNPLSPEKMIRGMELESVCGRLDGPHEVVVLSTMGKFVLFEFAGAIDLGIRDPHIGWDRDVVLDRGI